MAENATAAVTAEQKAKHEQSHREAELYDNPGARTAKGPGPVGYLTVLQFSDGTFDPDVDAAGLWPTLKHAVEDAETPEMMARLADGQAWRPCAVVPVEDGQR